MDNQSPYIRNLFSKYASGTANKVEVEELLTLLSDGKYDSEILSDMQAEIANASLDADLNRRRWAGVLDEIQHRIAAQPARKSLKLWPRIAAAAAIIVVVGAGLFYFSQKPTGLPQDQLVLNDIAPGTQGATLTLANGKKIKLTNAANGQLAKEAGVKISKSKDGKLIYEITGTDTDPNKINVLSTAKGETYEVRLPDGSLVALNAASSLSYPANFTALKERRVRLTGEGYFEIAKDKAHPFIVATDKQEVKVLGTHFNVNSYLDEPDTKTTLLEGSVMLTGLTGSKSKVLKPGEQAALKGTGIDISEVDVDEAIAWKNNKFMFDNESIESIMRKLSRWYNVEVVYEGNVRELPFTGSISRYDNISKILAKITFTQDVHFKVEGRRITVKP